MDKEIIYNYQLYFIVTFVIVFLFIGLLSFISIRKMALKFDDSATRSQDAIKTTLNYGIIVTFGMVILNICAIGLVILGIMNIMNGNHISGTFATTLGVIFLTGAIIYLIKGQAIDEDMQKIHFELNNLRSK
jgi:uncharacterized membrane protein YedE/YeeE